MKTNLTAIFFTAACLSLATLTGCAADTADSPTDGDEGEEIEVAEDAVTGAPSNFGYFRVTRRDFRKCISPICGGFYAKRVNDAKTLCADGSRQAECYVSTIQLTGIGLSAREEEELRGAVESGKALIKARTYKTKFGGRFYGTLKATEGWLGATGSDPDGTFYRAADNGIRCITAPCPSTSATTLNGSDSRSDSHNLTAIHLDGTDVPASPESIDAASNAMGSKEGILFAGGIALPKCGPGSKCGPFATVSEFYLRVVRREGKSCGGFRVGGPTACNAGQFCRYQAAAICGAADAPGQCAYKPQQCLANYQPVCGCDGKSYSNECHANGAGTSAGRLGACSP